LDHAREGRRRARCLDFPVATATRKKHSINSLLEKREKGAFPRVWKSLSVALGREEKDPLRFGGKKKGEISRRHS